MARLPGDADDYDYSADPVDQSDGGGQPTEDYVDRTGGSNDSGGSSGESVADLQRRLNSMGANLTVDGIRGPLTNAAEQKYLSGGSGSDSGTGGTQSTSNDDSQLILPGTSELWYNEDTKEWWVVYEIPQITLPDGSTSAQIYTGWLIPTTEDLTAVVGPGNTPKADFTGSTEDFTGKGLIDLGEIDELRDFGNLEGDPMVRCLLTRSRQRTGGVPIQQLNVRGWRRITVTLPQQNS